MLVRNFFDQFGTFDLNTLEWEEIDKPVYGPASQEGELRLDTLDEDDDSEVTICKWVDHYTDGAPECRLSVVTRGRGPEYDASSNNPRNWPILDQLFGGRKAWETWLENWQAEFIQAFTASENVYAAYNRDVYASGYGYYMERVEELDEPGVREVVFASDDSRSPHVMIYRDKNTGKSHIMHTHPDNFKVTTSANPADHTALDVIFGNREVWEGLCTAHKGETATHEKTTYTLEKNSGAIYSDEITVRGRTYSMVRCDDYDQSDTSFMVYVTDDSDLPCDDRPGVSIITFEASRETGEAWLTYYDKAQDKFFFSDDEEHWPILDEAFGSREIWQDFLHRYSEDAREEWEKEWKDQD